MDAKTPLLANEKLLRPAVSEMERVDEMIILSMDRTQSESESIGGLNVTIGQNDSVGVRDKTSEKRFVLESLTGDGPTYFIAVDDEFVYVSGESSERIWILNIGSGDYRGVDLNRKEANDSDFYRQNVVPTESGLLFVYEAGILLLRQGNLCWSVEHDRIDWFFKFIDGRVAIYESEHEGLWGYSLETGERMDV